MKFSSCAVLTQSLLCTARNRRRQQSAFMCTAGAMRPNLDVPAAERRELGSPFPFPSPAQLSLRSPLSRSSHVSLEQVVNAVTFGDSSGLPGVPCPRSPLGFSCTEPEPVTHSSLPRTLALFPYKSPCYQAQLNPFHREMKQVSNPWA